ncbi:Uma2 family endonuclease [Funiculus sociatus GB2-A5]|uniref:Uma2 family endonuclease n=1 Tax=Funiculus sociatus GB2-A5 TaxID=2933946 RepID=A0ABV0JJE9_9CYAN|nr:MULTISPECIES: Uma2 family endonuclease [unclassified Trichocoleus]MBD1908471.1 Uma2 family endonuclease [Trichocoleus sp. FACHB-832]MBD2061627.1 Uma2 family endonuclease [Trichocoleus sp. FACHB-6]
MTIFSQLDSDLLYPDSDGKPMADDTEQYRWIVIIKENLEILFAAINDVFIAADLLWYPVKSKIVSPTAPDVMVVFGRHKGKRRSYRQWQEDNIPPQVVFEILSLSNNQEEMDRKLEFYDTYGVEEYYLYDPESYELEGWLRQDQHLTKLWQMDGWTSPRLRIRFATGQGELVIYRPDGQRFLTSVELQQQVEQAQLLLQQERLRAEQERLRAEQLAAYLRSLGVDPDNLP